MLAPHGVPRLDEIAFDGQALAFTALATVLVGLGVGIAPLLTAREGHALELVRARTQSGGGAGGRSRAWLVATQVAFTFVLLVAAALLLRSFARLQGTDVGYRRHDVVSAEVRVPGGRFGPGRQSWGRRLQHYESMMAELARLPGVQAVAGITEVPLTGEIGSGRVWRTDAPGASGSRPPDSAEDQWDAAVQVVTPGYVETMGIPVVRGRALDAGDRFTLEQLAAAEGPRPVGVALINEAMAKRYWPGRDPIGQTIVEFDDRSFASHRTIVGVVGNVRATAVSSPPEPAVYFPFAQSPGRALSLVVRTSLPPGRMAGTIASSLRAFDPELTIRRVRPLEAVVDESLARERFTLALVAVFAALGLVIAAVGVFGVVGYVVARRTGEIGIRVALGASRAHVLRTVLAEGLTPVVLGVLAGVAGGVAVAQGMRVMLYGLEPLDAASFALAAALLVGAAVAAALVPALRAAAVDPLRALREG
jgi:putative ABC transport system permease protein